MAGSSGLDDAIQYAEVNAFVAAALNITVFNRAIGGNKLSDMDARWNADISVLAARSKYVIIQGGINDIANGRTLAQMQASVSSMVTKAGVDGLIPVILTATPTTSIAANATFETLRLNFNDWLKQTYVNVIDIACVIEDPADRSKIRSDPDWVGDGIHYGYAAKRAVGAFIAAWPNWEFYQPGPYQKITGAIGSFTPSSSLVEGTSGLIIGQRSSGWSLPTGTFQRTILTTFTKGFTASASAITPSAAYTQSEATSVASRLQTTEAALDATQIQLQTLSRTVGALLNDLHINGVGSTMGIIGVTS